MIVFMPLWPSGSLIAGISSHCPAEVIPSSGRSGSIADTGLQVVQVHSVGETGHTRPTTDLAACEGLSQPVG